MVLLTCGFFKAVKKPSSNLEFFVLLLLLLLHTHTTYTCTHIGVCVCVCLCVGRLKKRFKHVDSNAFLHNLFRGLEFSTYLCLWKGYTGQICLLLCSVYWAVLFDFYNQEVIQSFPGKGDESKNGLRPAV